MLSAKIATYPQLVCLYNCSSEPDKYISSFSIYIFKAGCLSLDANPLGHVPSMPLSRQAADDLILIIYLDTYKCARRTYCVLQPSEMK